MRTGPGSKGALIVPAIVVVGGLLLTLSGCSSSSGLTPLEARDAVENAPGVESATVTTGTDRDTLGKSYFVNVRVTIRDGLMAAEQQCVVDYSAATGWATDIRHKPYGLRLQVTSSPSVDVWQILKDMEVASAPAPNDRSFVLISAKEMNEKWGNWPTRVPS